MNSGAFDPLDQPPPGTVGPFDAPQRSVLEGPEYTDLFGRSVGVIFVFLFSVMITTPMLGSGDGAMGLSLLITATAGYFLLRNSMPTTSYPVMGLTAASTVLFLILIT